MQVPRVYSSSPFSAPPDYHPLNRSPAPFQLTHKRIIERELEGMGIRLNKRPPNITFTKKEKGGIAFRSTFPQPYLEEDTVKVGKSFRFFGGVYIIAAIETETH